MKCLNINCFIYIDLFYIADTILGDVQNMNPFPRCTGTIFCSYLAILYASLEESILEYLTILLAFTTQFFLCYAHRDLSF